MSLCAVHDCDRLPERGMLVSLPGAPRRVETAVCLPHFASLADSEWVFSAGEILTGDALVDASIFQATEVAITTSRGLFRGNTVEQEEWTTNLHFTGRCLGDPDDMSLDVFLNPEQLRQLRDLLNEHDL